MPPAARLKAWDFYRKVPKDLTEASVPGAVFSLITTLSILLLITAEFRDFIITKASTELVVDRSPPDEYLRVAFDIDFPNLNCEFLEIDVTDALGVRRFNLTKTVMRTPLDKSGNPVLNAAQSDKDMKKRKRSPRDEGDDYVIDRVVSDLEEEFYKDRPDKRQKRSSRDRKKEKRGKSGKEDRKGSRRGLLQVEQGAVVDENVLDPTISPSPPLDPQQQVIPSPSPSPSPTPTIPTPTTTDVSDPTEDGKSIVDPLTDKMFDTYIASHPIVLVAFIAPWCPWCQKLQPAWDAATREVYSAHSSDGLRFAMVDCTAEQKLCLRMGIQAFPTIRIFRHGSDELDSLTHQHATYYGDRSKDALIAFAEKLLDIDPSRRVALQQGKHDLTMLPTSASPGCNLAGFLLLKKVPGAISFVALSDAHSINVNLINTTHTVNHFFYGEHVTRGSTRPAVARLHPSGLSDDWLDRLADTRFVSKEGNMTHEHYLQVMLTTVEPLRGDLVDAYEYTLHSHTYKANMGGNKASGGGNGGASGGGGGGVPVTPMVRFQYDVSPVQIWIREQRRPFYKFVTSLCAIIGGVFTVFSMVDGSVYALRSMYKKVDLGKLH